MNETCITLARRRQYINTLEAITMRGGGGDATSGREAEVMMTRGLIFCAKNLTRRTLLWHMLLTARARVPFLQPRDAREQFRRQSTSVNEQAMYGETDQDEKSRQSSSAPRLNDGLESSQLQSAP